MFAATANCEAAVEYLLSIHADVNKQRPSVRTQMCGNWRCCLTRRMCCEQTKETALHRACKNDNIRIVEILLRHGASPSLRNNVSLLTLIAAKVV
jgi:ankyrin repeat protein